MIQPRDPARCPAPDRTVHRARDGRTGRVSLPPSASLTKDQTRDPAHMHIACAWNLTHSAAYATSYRHVGSLADPLLLRICERTVRVPSTTSLSNRPSVAWIRHRDPAITALFADTGQHARLHKEARQSCLLGAGSHCPMRLFSFSDKLLFSSSVIGRPRNPSF